MLVAGLVGSALSWHGATLLRPRAARPSMVATATPEPLVVSPTSQLAQLAEVTTLSIDTGDLDVIAQFSHAGVTLSMSWLLPPASAFSVPRPLYSNGRGREDVRRRRRGKCIFRSEL